MRPDTTELLVFKCFTGVLDDKTKELMRRVRVPDNVTRKNVLEWLSNLDHTDTRYMVVDALQWDVAKIKSKTVKVAKWVGKAYINEDGGE